MTRTESLQRTIEFALKALDLSQPDPLPYSENTTMEDRLRTRINYATGGLLHGLGESAPKSKSRNGGRS